MTEAVRKSEKGGRKKEKEEGLRKKDRQRRDGQRKDK